MFSSNKQTSYFPPQQKSDSAKTPKWYKECVDSAISLAFLDEAGNKHKQQVYEDLDRFIIELGYDVRCLGYDPYNAKEFVERWEKENGPFGIEKVIQGARTESVPLGELKAFASERMLLFDQELMTFAMGNAITIEDNNGNRKLLKKRYDQKIDPVAAMMDAFVAYKLNKEAFE